MLDLDNAKRILDRPYDEDWPRDASKALREALGEIERLRKGREVTWKKCEGCEQVLEIPDDAHKGEPWWCARCWQEPGGTH